MGVMDSSPAPPPSASLAPWSTEPVGDGENAKGEPGRQPSVATPARGRQGRRQGPALIKATEGTSEDRKGKAELAPTGISGERSVGPIQGPELWSPDQDFNQAEAEGHLTGAFSSSASSALCGLPGRRRINPALQSALRCWVGLTVFIYAKADHHRCRRAARCHKATG